MKTAEEIALPLHCHHNDGLEMYLTFKDAIKAMQDYASQFKPISLPSSLSDEERDKIAAKIIDENKLFQMYEVTRIENGICKAIDFARSFYEPKIAALKEKEGKFSEWCKINKWDYDEQDEVWYKVMRDISTTTAELYQQFLTETQNKQA